MFFVETLFTKPSHALDCHSPDQIAYHCVRNSSLHPRFRTLPPFHTFMALGEDLYGRNQVDPLSVGLAEELG